MRPATREWMDVWTALETEGARDPDITIAPGGRVFLAYVRDDGAKVVARWWETTEAEPEAELTVAEGTNLRHPSVVAWPDGRLGCWYVADGVQKAKYSADGGNTWTELTGMLGDDLQYAAVCQFKGLTFAAGYNKGACVVEWSNDNGATKSAVPGGGNTVTVSSSMADEQQPAICVLPTGQVKVLVPETDGMVRGYVSDSGGIGDFRAAGEFAA